MHATYMLSYVCFTYVSADANYWDEGEISSDHYQRPYKFFLQLSDESAYDESPSEDLDNHSFAKSEVWSLANKEKILRTVLKYSLSALLKYNMGLLDRSHIYMHTYLSIN